MALKKFNAMEHIEILETVLKGHFNWHGSRISFLARFVVALFSVKTVNLAEIATGFLGKAKIESNYKRLQRFFRFFQIDFTVIAKCIAGLLPIKDELWILSMDRTNWKFGRVNINILMLGIAYKGIAFPLLWILLPKRGNSNTVERIALMERFIAVFGLKKIQCLTADREFIGHEWFTYLRSRGICFRIRVKKNAIVSNSKGIDVHVSHFFRGLKPGQYDKLSGKKDVSGHKLYIIGLRLKDGDYLIVVTDKQPDTALEDYAKRWEIETLFGCLKSRGFCFESTHITESQRISKLIALLAIAFCWAHLIGEWLHEQKPIPIKNHNRKAKSLFRYGLDYLRNILLNISTKIQEFRLVILFLAYP